MLLRRHDAVAAPADAWQEQRSIDNQHGSEVCLSMNDDSMVLTRTCSQGYRHGTLVVLRCCLKFLAVQGHLVESVALRRRLRQLMRPDKYGVQGVVDQWTLRRSQDFYPGERLL